VKKRFLRRLGGKRRGFTLIELLIVLSILAVLAAVVVLALTGFIGRGEKAACQADEDAIQTAVVAYYYENDGTWPGTASGDPVVYDLWGAWVDGAPPADASGLIPTFLTEVPATDENADWHIDADGIVFANGTDCTE